jgi:hypothetical protein
LINFAVTGYCQYFPAGEIFNRFFQDNDGRAFWHVNAWFLYLKVNIASAILTVKEKAFERTMILSAFIDPYHIHKPNPPIKTVSMPSDTSLAFFSLNNLIS